MNLKQEKEIIGFREVDLLGEVAIYLIHRKDGMERTLHKIWDKNEKFSYEKVEEEKNKLKKVNISSVYP